MKSDLPEGTQLVNGRAWTALHVCLTLTPMLNSQLLPYFCERFYWLSGGDHKCSYLSSSPILIQSVSQAHQCQLTVVVADTNSPL